MDFLKKLQNQPRHIRKLILWLIVVIVALTLAAWWIHSSYWKIRKFPEEKIIEELSLPEIEIPTINEQ